MGYNLRKPMIDADMRDLSQSQMTALQRQSFAGETEPQFCNMDAHQQ